ncbi:flagellar motor protein MotA [Deltaproteobacteria bacterium]|nr:flagellar motor protein MotA [Deltaproteobacteria bacterium]
MVLILAGYIVVFASVIGGFMMAGGNVGMLIHPNEIIIIAGAGIGAFIAGCTGFTLKGAIKGMLHCFIGHSPGKAEYLDLLSVLFGLFSKMHREGVISIEKDIEAPESSSLFQRSPRIGKDLVACRFIGDTLRVYLTTGNAGELDKLMGVDIASMHEEEMAPAHAFERMAESLPGMGIVAAVLGVVLTMAHINDGAEVLGHSIGAALIGTFVGILLCYGVFGPIGGKMVTMAEEKGFFFHTIREAVAAAVRGSSPIIAIEYGRRAIPLAFRPTFQEMEQTCKG